MDDRQIEQMLRDSWSPEPPQGMKERVLRAGRREIRNRRSGRAPFLPCRWKTLLAGAAVVFVLVAHISDSALQNHISGIETCASQHQGVPAQVLLARQKELREMLLRSSYDTLPYDMEGDGLL